MKRRIKPKALLLSDRSRRSVMRLVAALAITSADAPDEYRLTQRAEKMLRLLREMA